MAEYDCYRFKLKLSIDFKRNLVVVFENFRLSFKIFPTPKLIVFKKLLQTLTMAADSTNVDPSNTTNDDVISQPFLKIQSSNAHLLPTVDQNPKQL